MLAILKNFFATTESQSDEASQQHQIELACAVLLVEVMRADSQFENNEVAMLADLVGQQFSLSSEELNNLIILATDTAEHATDIHQFTSQLNKAFSIKQRIEMVEQLWHVAYADGKLAAIEEHTIRKIADLLHLRHAEYIQTKVKAQQTFTQDDDK